MKKTLRLVALGLITTLNPMGLSAQNHCDIDLNKQISNDEEICEGDEANVTLFSPQLGVHYELKNTSSNQILTEGTQVNGNLKFSTGALSSAQDYAIYGTKHQNTSLKLGGNADYISMDASNFDYEKGYTFEAMVNTDLPGSNGGHKTLFYVGGALGSDIEIYIQESTHDIVAAHNRGNSGTIGSVIYNGVIPENQWFHLAVSYDGSDLTIFIDGVDVANGVVPTISKSANPELVIGYFNSSAFSWAQSFNGQLDEVRIWNDARTLLEIQENRNTNFLDDETGLNSYFKFNEGAGDSTLEETSHMMYPITNVNTNNLCWVHNNNLGNKDKAISLPGTSDRIGLDASSFSYENGYSIATWWNTSLPSNTSNGHRTLFYSGGAEGSDIEIYIQAGTKDVVVLHNRDNSGTLSSIIVDKDLPNNEWFHFAVTYNGTDVTIYVNGEMFATKTIVAPLHSINSESTIGYCNSSTWINGSWNQVFNDALDEISIWNKALSQEEVQGIIDNGLMGDEADLNAYFPIEEHYNETILDLVSNTEVAIINGALNTIPRVLDLGISEDFALWLTGDADAIEGDAADFAYDQAYAFEAWIKESRPGTGGGHKSIFYLGGDAGSDVEIYIQETTNDLVVVHNRDNGGTIGSRIYSQSIPNDQWFHFAVSFDGTNVEVYINGISLGAGPIIAPVKAANTAFSIGQINSSAFPWSQTFNGAIDGIKIWSLAKTQSDVLVDMGAKLNGNENGLFGYFDLNEGTSDTIWNKATGEAVVISNYQSGSAWNTMEGKVGNLICTEMIGKPFTILVNTPGPLDLSTSLNNMLITANQDNATYQWFNCNLDLPVAGESGQSYLSSSEGSWAVIVDNGCETDTSTCVDIVVGLEETGENALVYYPNPASDKVFVGNGTIEVFDQRGINVLNIDSDGWIDISALENGLYIIQNGINRQKLFVE